MLAPLEEGAATVMAMGSDGARRGEERIGIRKKGPRLHHQNPIRKGPLAPSGCARSGGR